MCITSRGCLEITSLRPTVVRSVHWRTWQTNHQCCTLESLDRARHSTVGISLNCWGTPHLLGGIRSNPLDPSRAVQTSTLSTMPHGQRRHRRPSCRHISKTSKKSPTCPSERKGKPTASMDRTWLPAQLYRPLSRVLDAVLINCRALWPQRSSYMLAVLCPNASHDYRHTFIRPRAASPCLKHHFHVRRSSRRRYSPALTRGFVFVQGPVFRD